MKQQENIVDSVKHTLERIRGSLGCCSGVEAQNAAENIDEALENISQLNIDQHNSYRP